MNQVESILASNAPTFMIGKERYKGRVPMFMPITNELGQVTGYEKIQRGIPFVRLHEK